MFLIHIWKSSGGTGNFPAVDLSVRPLIDLEFVSEKEEISTSSTSISI